MSGASKAVFLSYASQDAEAARRIADALRAAGIEVWFDQNELVGGDAWDQKIRGQISSCGLFLPVISANTQARLEGYFRLEWKLAAQRTHTMADEKAFLLPIVIDGTRDADAKAPPEFKAVQWTRLPDGATTPAFAARVQKLLAGEMEAGRPAPAERNERAAARTISKWWWLAPIFGMTMALALVFKEREPKAEPAAAVTPPVAATAAPPKFSEARELATKACALVRGLEATREDYALAEEYCQKAIKLDPEDGEVWAASSQVHAAFVYRGWDASPERREQERVTAERAIRLAPQSVEARLAQAGAWSTFGVNRDEREKLLRGIVRDDPGNKGALRFLAVTVLAKPGGLAEALELNERSAALPGGDALALFNNARYLWNAGQLVQAYAMLQRSLAQKTFVSALVFKMVMEVNWRGDLAAADATLKQIPSSALLEDRANYTAGLIRYYQRDAAAALGIWQSFPRSFYSDFVYDGPKGFLVGLADELDHRDAAARIEWKAALQEMEKKIAATPNQPSGYYNKAVLLAHLGETAAANEALQTYEQLGGGRAPSGQPLSLPIARLYARLGRFDEIFARPPVELPVLRIAPTFDALRADPRFPQLLERAAPAAPPTGEISPPAAAPDQKSVAVLAFANLSDDKANEYFSDGISEELLNVLAKIPNLKVAARTSAFYFKGKEVPVPEIAKQLGVAYVVEGSVRKAGDKVRITAQLIKASDGFHVWSDTFTRDLKDVFAVQDEIAGLIAGNISPVLSPPKASGDRILAPEAIQEYLVGRAAAARAGMADLREAVRHFERAVEVEPKFTAAWVQLANAHTRLGRWGGAPAIPSWQAARAAIDRAVALEPDSPEVLLALGWVLRTGEWKWREAERAFRRAQELRPHQPEILAGTAVLLYNVGQTDEAMRLGLQAAQLDPLNAATQIDLSIMFYLNGNLAEAEQAARRALQLAPGGTSYHAILAWSLIDQKRFAEAEAEIALDPDPVEQPTAYGRLALARGDGATARKMIAHLEELARTNPDLADLQQSIAWICSGLGGSEKDRAFAALERARVSRDPSMAWLIGSRYLTPLHSDPRWDVLLRQVGLADDQLK